MNEIIHLLDQIIKDKNDHIAMLEELSAYTTQQMLQFEEVSQQSSE